MAEEPTKESPVIEEPVAEPKDTPQVDIKTEVLSELESLGISTPDQLQNMAKASSEAGKLANMVGELRQEVASLKNQPKPQDDYYDEPQGQPVDLSQVMYKTIDRYMTDYQMKQAENDERFYTMMTNVQSHPKYKEVESVFEKHMKSPAIQASVRKGNTDVEREFNRVVTTYQDRLIEKLSEKVETIATASTVKPPHMESGDTGAAPTLTQDQETQEKIKKMTKPDVWKGTNDDIEKLVGAVLGGE